MKLTPHPSHPRAFTLTEVVIALGIAAFALASITGLFTVALRAGNESVETTGASHLATRLLAERKIYPIDNAASPPAIEPVLPPLDASSTNFNWAAGTVNTPLYVGEDGAVTSLDRADFAVAYTITKGKRSTAVHLILYWPPQAKLENAAGRYEVRTSMPLPPAPTQP